MRQLALDDYKTLVPESEQDHRIIKTCENIIEEKKKEYARRFDSPALEPSRATFLNG